MKGERGTRENDPTLCRPLREPVTRGFTGGYGSRLRQNRAQKIQADRSTENERKTGELLLRGGTQLGLALRSEEPKGSLQARNGVHLKRRGAVATPGGRACLVNERIRRGLKGLKRDYDILVKGEEGGQIRA